MNDTIDLTPTVGGAPLPIACDLMAIPAEERKTHVALTERLFGELARERREEGGAIALRFDAADYPSVAAFVANERLCCGFLTFTITVTPTGGPLWLRIEGDAGTLASMLAIPAQPAATT